MNEDNNKRPLSILMLEDNPMDAELIIATLEQEGYKIVVQQVAIEKEFLDKLKNNIFDFVLSDYNLPGYSGMAALKEVRQIYPEIPFICISGTIGEDLAVDLLKEGATDYVLKDKLEKLPIAINRALNDIHKQKELKSAEAELRILSSAIQQSPSTIAITDTSGIISYVNPQFCAVSGYSATEVEGKLLRVLKKGTTYNETHKEIWDTIKAGNTWNGEYLSKRRSGELFWERTKISPILSSDNKIINYLSISEDITEQKRTELAIQESEKTFRLLFDNNPLCMWVYDINSLRFLSVNQMAIKKYGYSEEEFYGMTLKEIQPESDINTLLDKINNVKESSTGWRHQLKSGEIIDVEIISHSIVFKEKQARLVVAIDITARMAAEREIRKLSQAVQQGPVSIIITNIEGNIEYVNNRTSEMTGYSKDELIGQPHTIVRSEDMSKEEYISLWNTILNGGTWAGETQNKKKNGEQYWVSATISPIIDSEGRIIHVLDIKEDITERKKITQELIISKEKAEASDKLKTAFMNNISHEVRTPLNGILGFASLINQPNLDQPTKDQYLSILNTSSERLLSTITNYIDISLLVTETIELHLKPTSVGVFLRNLQESFEIKCNGKGLYLKVEISDNVLTTIINTDQGLLEKALHHLLDNAIKFTKNGGITIQCIITNELLSISIIDTGVGIELNAQENIFGYFIQGATDNTRGYEGSGLGLSIAKEIVTLLGGSISFESEIHLGSTFTISLPITHSL